MKILITGGAGFLGRRLAQKILERGTLRDTDGTLQTVHELTLVDQVAASGWNDARVRTIAGDVGDASLLRRLIESDTASVFHLAAIVSAQAEEDFDLGYRVNADATRALLEFCRASKRRIKFVFASSVAVFGGPLPARVRDDTALTPQSSYGTQKAIGELLVNDYSRKRYVDGRALRLPTIVVRPGKPNRAASSFASGIIREPLTGVEAICPVRPELPLWISSPRAVIDNIIIGHDADAGKFTHTRAVNVPGLSIRVGDMVETLRAVAGDAVAARVKWQYDPVIAPLVESWPKDFDPAFGTALGMRADTDFASIVRAYIDDDMPGKVGI